MNLVWTQPRPPAPGVAFPADRLRVSTSRASDVPPTGSLPVACTLDRAVWTLQIRPSPWPCMGRKCQKTREARPNGTAVSPASWLATIATFRHGSDSRVLESAHEAWQFTAL